MRMGLGNSFLLETSRSKNRFLTRSTLSSTRVLKVYFRLFEFSGFYLAARKRRPRLQRFGSVLQFCDVALLRTVRLSRISCARHMLSLFRNKRRRFVTLSYYQLLAEKLSFVSPREIIRSLSLADETEASLIKGNLSQTYKEPWIRKVRQEISR